MSDIEPVDGLAIRKAIAEKVFGWRSVKRTTPRFPAERIYLKGIPPGVEDEPEHVPRYELDIAAAWTVVEKLEPDWFLTLYQSRQGRVWIAEFIHRFESAGIGKHPADTPSLAICRAALLAVEG